MDLKNGVYPVYKNQWQVGPTKDALTNIADMETFSVSLDNGIEEWNPMDQEGWVRRLMTAKSVTISISGKRNFGDTGNDYVAGLALKNGRDVEGCLQWTFPDGATLLFENAIFSVTNWGAGKSTDVIPLEFDALSNGKPTYTEAVKEEAQPAQPAQASAKSSTSK